MTVNLQSTNRFVNDNMVILLYLWKNLLLIILHNANTCMCILTSSPCARVGVDQIISVLYGLTIIQPGTMYM